MTATRPRRRTMFEGAWIGHLAEMRKSPAWRVLSLSARRVLDRLEIENAEHGGAENGRLIVTFNQFVEFGVDRHAIAPAIRELVALGFVEVTEQGSGGNREFHRPSRYRLTHLRTKDREKPPHEWRRVKTDAQAAELARNARAERPLVHRKQKSDVGKHTVPVWKARTGKAGIPV